MWHRKTPVIAVDTATTSVPSGRELADALDLPYVDSLAGRTFSAEFVTRVPIGFARHHKLIGLVGDPPSQATNPQNIAVAFAHLEQWEQLDVLRRFLGARIDPVVATPEVILSAINEAYQQRCGQAQETIQALDRSSVLSELQNVNVNDDLLDVAARAPVIKLVNLMLFEAVKSLASDVHVQPYAQKLVVRMRIDGVLYDSFELPRSIHDEVTSRIKVMGHMNIAEKRLPQDGRATVQVGDRLVDLRIASLPTSFGERVVIRLLDKSARLYRLSELGMPAATLLTFKRLITAENGLLLVTGPTGGGKTTTLYAALKELDSTAKNILSLEDPIEYQLEGISQTQVNPKKGLTFATGLRNVLRQDPDIIMVGEIRDRETAAMAIQSALTGHLVFSTLHTNDAASAVTRLLDLGVEPYLVASSLIGVLAQRLVRRVCSGCGALLTPTEKDLAWLGLQGRTPGHAMRFGSGCATCRRTGFAGRLGIFELLSVNEAVRRQIQGCMPAARIKAAAMAGGMRTLRDDGVEKILAGMTTVAEVERVAGDNDLENTDEPVPIQNDAAHRSTDT